MSWQVKGPGGRHAAMDDKGKFTADVDTQVEIWGFEGAPVPITPTGPSYNATGDDDPVWLYLAALHAIPGPHTITGDRPPVPEVPSDEGVVY